MQPCCPLLQPCDTGHISAASLPAPAGAPERVCEACPRRPAPPAAGGAGGSSGGHGLQWDEREAAGVAQSDVHPSEPPATLGSPSVRLTWRAVPGRWGHGLGVETPHRGAFGFGGAGRSCPFSTYCSIASPNAEEPPNIGWVASLSPCTSGPLDPSQNGGEKPPTRSASTPLPLSPPGLG